MFKFLQRLTGHVWLATRELGYGVVKLRQPVPEALNFFAMRLLTPFGFFRGWDRKRSSSEHPELEDLSGIGFTELAPLPDAQVETLKRHFCRSVDAAQGRTYPDLPAYLDHYRAERVQRPRGLLATGRNDCPITQIALSDRFVELAAEFLDLDKTRMVAAASIDALVRFDQPRKVIGGYDDALAWHRDIDSYRFLKINAILTDVEIDGGHHEVYLQSQISAPIRLGPIARYSNEEIEAAIGTARLHKVKGPAGYTFAENTFGFHRGTRPVKGDRLILNLQYMEDTFRVRYPEAFDVIRRNTLPEAA